MATVPGPPVSLSQVRSVFGAPAGTPLHAFVRGGAWVPNIAANNGVPTAPPIRLAQLAGATNYVPLSATASPTSAVGNASGPNSSGYVYSDTVTVSGSGGSGSYTYSWSIISGSVTINTPNSAATYFSAIVTVSGPLSATARCTVSDGTTTVHVDVPVTLTYTRQ